MTCAPMESARHLEASAACQNANNQPRYAPASLAEPSGVTLNQIRRSK